MLNNNKTKQEMVDAIGLMSVAYSRVGEFGSAGMPSGHLYAEMMSAFSDVNAYQGMVDLLVKTGLLSKRGDLLIAAKV
jgi:hypothetical protein